MTEAGTREVAGPRLPTVSRRAHRRLAVLALAALFLIVVSGATVRLTGSGLGCENWPRCGDTVLPAKDVNAYVEFGNRVVGFLVGLTTLAAAFAAWRAGVDRSLFRLTLALPFLVLAQGILGGITVLFELHPLIVMGHFLLSLFALALAVTVVLGAYASPRASPGPEAPPWLGRLALALVPLALALVVTGALVTAAGPHSGGEDIQRFGDLEAAIYVHVRASAVFGVGFLVLLAALLRRRATARIAATVALTTFVLLVVQMVIGEVQWRDQLPWVLVLAHVTVATGVWTGVVALAALLRAPGNARPVP
ncbi:MAG: COX15/CtaA family protein [Thermoleophilia bacterium]|nr:COX15/CtaA family protein [Thermoleophilia bacterium]